ncbi:hypothetical protein JX580_05820 [Thiomicrospira microaerophila]|uniref:tyrosine-protein phosphatase n=1 Tax=Thiomicrospira microaerophila TaxID=406020 RepID=UPI00200FE47B|nr:CpsB/CapC family capsule biosynthesis tyrosine phosphatase [Thiomicrospira microaerophila]UQB43375.1 hypothetical protein JX580_05820 [Thiomicrospira microaerophila]
MFDIHNHLLPGIDDGAANINESLELLELAQQQGISHLVNTPHIHPGRFDNDLNSITKASQLLSAALEQSQLTIQLAVAAEVRICPEILTWVKTQTLPFIGQWQDKPALLLELPTNQLPVGSDKLVGWLVQQGIQPILAHPERHAFFYNQPSRLQPFIRLGCLFQITAGSVLGDFGSAPQDFAMQLLREQQVDFIASDAHNQRFRPPKLADAFNFLAQDASFDLTRVTLKHNQRELTQSLFKLTPLPSTRL